jgi:alanyl-tRNA synthetase
VKLKTLIHEPAYHKILDRLITIAEQNDYIFVTPTPIISPFWKTTFTPSSSEVIFRHLGNELVPSSRVYTVQPCIRINDLPHLNDGWHCLLFHMVSFFLLDITKFEEAVAVILKTIMSVTNLDLTDFYFTVPTNPYCPNALYEEALGFDLLQKIGITREQIIWCAGADNYQDSSIVTAEGQKMSMTGPKIEIFAMPPYQDKLYEVATCVLETACRGETTLGNVFACAIGLERLATLSEGKNNITELTHHQDLRNTICSSLLHPSMARSSLGKNASSQIILMVDALACISLAQKGNGKYDRGITNHYRRVVKKLSRLMKATGIPLNDLMQVISKVLGKDDIAVIDLNFLSQQIAEEVVGYV